MRTLALALVALLLTTPVVGFAGAAAPDNVPPDIRWVTPDAWGFDVRSKPSVTDALTGYVSGDVVVKAIAIDGLSGMARMRFELDNITGNGKTLGTITGPGPFYSLVWDTHDPLVVRPGFHVLTARATDKAGNEAIYYRFVQVVPTVPSLP